MDNGSSVTWGAPATFHSLTAHLTPSHCTFLAHWLRLVDLEEANSRAKRPEVWALSGEQREEAGSCISGLVLQVGGD